jgi:integrase
MKMKKQHIVPISTQSLAILEGIRQLNHHSPLLFPNMRGGDGHMSTESLNRALELMGYKGRMSGHGFRTLATGVLTEQLGYSYDLVDLQLAHSKAKVRAAYDRAQHLPQRQTMMQAYSGYIEGQIKPIEAVFIQKAC